MDADRRQFIYSQTSYYAELRALLTAKGVFEPQLRHYALHASLIVGLLVFSLAPLLLWQSVWLRLSDAVLLALAFTHLAYIIHDAGHRQVFGKTSQNDLLMLAVGYVVGTSRSWWFGTHNAHHSHPNDLELDPNTALPMLAFSEQQALNQQRLLRKAMRFQVFYFFPLLGLEAVGVRAASLQFLFARKSKYPLVEGVGIVLHLAWYATLLFYVMPIEQVALFFLVHQGLTGFYMGMIFAPNHKGMLVPDPAEPLDFFHRQVLSSRNIKPSPLVDFLFGGLNYQIEHHLFPTIPRNKLKDARSVVKAFCSERGVPYHETGVWQSYCEVASYFNRMSAPLRQPCQTSSRGRLPGRNEHVVALTATHVEGVEVAGDPSFGVVLEAEPAGVALLARPAPETPAATA